MVKEPNMSYALPKRATNHLHIDESGVHTRANDKQVGGDHYKNMGVEPWDVVDTWPLEQRIGYYRGGALKYIMRMGGKDEEVQEIGKGMHYIEKLLEVLKEQGNENV